MKSVCHQKITICAAMTAIAFCAVPAMADVVISTDATQNMSCSGGVCAPTASDAFLNTDDLTNQLSTGPLTVTTTGAGVQATNIDVTAAFSWSFANTLTLDANQSITVSAGVSDSGDGGVSLVTNDGGSGGTLSFLHGGNVTISNLQDPLTINGEKYKLENDVAGLAHDIVANPNGRFALANDYDVKGNKIFRSPPIPVVFSGTFTGLGHAIANVEIGDIADSEVGFFAVVAGTVSGIGLENVVVQTGGQQDTGGLAGFVTGTLQNSWVSGKIRSYYYSGGLAGTSEGTVANSWSSALVEGQTAGGLIGENEGAAVSSFATGNATGGEAGGLVGYNEGSINDSYAIGASKSNSGAIIGGLIGAQYRGSTNSSYSTGRVKGGAGSTIGGFAGYNDTGAFKDCDWDTKTSRTETGVGNEDSKGVHGLTTRKLRSHLPKGFDSAIWAEDPAINNGFPYLIANPPPQ